VADEAVGAAGSGLTRPTVAVALGRNRVGGILSKRVQDVRVTSTHPTDLGGAMTDTPNEPLEDGEITTDPSAEPTEPTGPGGDADGTDGDATDGTDGDGTDGDATDGDGTDGDGTDGTDGPEAGAF
jgi:hypothetical protein